MCACNCETKKAEQGGRKETAECIVLFTLCSEQTGRNQIAKSNRKRITPKWIHPKIQLYPKVIFYFIFKMYLLNCELEEKFYVEIICFDNFAKNPTFVVYHVHVCARSFRCFLHKNWIPFIFHSNCNTGIFFFACSHSIVFHVVKTG